MSKEALAVILLIFAIAAVGLAVYRVLLPHLDRVSIEIENVWTPMS